MKKPRELLIHSTLKYHSPDEATQLLYKTLPDIWTPFRSDHDKEIFASVLQMRDNKGHTILYSALHSRHRENINIFLKFLYELLMKQILTVSAYSNILLNQDSMTKEKTFKLPMCSNYENMKAYLDRLHMALRQEHITPEDYRLTLIGRTTKNESPLHYIMRNRSNAGQILHLYFDTLNAEPSIDQAQITRLLIDRSRDGLSALDIALTNNSIKPLIIYMQQLEKKTNLHQITSLLKGNDNSIMPPLQHAVNSGQIEYVTIFIEFAETHLESSDFKKIINRRLENLSPEMIGFLKAKRSKKNKPASHPQMKKGTKKPTKGEAITPNRGKQPSEETTPSHKALTTTPQNRGKQPPTPSPEALAGRMFAPHSPSRESVQGTSGNPQRDQRLTAASHSGQQEDGRSKSITY